MQRLAILASLATALLVSSVDAQTRYIPTNTPSTGTCNVIPFGIGTSSATWSNQRYQTIASFADLGSPAGVLNICNIGFASCGTTNNVIHFDTIEITMAQTDLAVLSTTFATNLKSNVKTVLKCTDYNWHHVGNVFSRIGLERDYLYLPHATDKNVVVDICLTGVRKCVGGTTGMHRTNNRQRVYAVGWAASTGCPATGSTDQAALKWCIDVNSWSMEEYGKGCQSLDLALSGSAQLGQALTITATGGTGTCALAIGVGCLNPGFDLGVIGATGCTVYCLPLIIVPGATLNATVPNNTQLACQRFCVQAFCRSSTYPGGIATSQVGKIMPGMAR